MVVFGACPSASSVHELSFTLFNSQLKISFISMFAQFLTTPLIFLAKFIFTLYMYANQTVVIKIPLVREVMPKRGLAVFLRSRDERRSSHRRTLSLRRSANGSSPSRRSVIGGSQEAEGVEEGPGTAGAVPHEGSRELQHSLSTYQVQEDQEDTAHAPDPPDE
eukprot:CAMPEP_0182567492 /NCGR_PEP_ID=MMETSP1324-20130603/8708_1 /TAXON_ID=236786 /ORGANISM="Florenciella sp., Strain RCC1587" /LENGTH=162 /DNA_ID=CAMNT_0024781503 /DNA_START=103 /DNA_END=591 /DNA_ORIENTATION=-